MNVDKISVIIPFYNLEKYLNMCLKSVTEQSFKNLEIILVDDGSTDSSIGVCKRYIESDSRIKLLHQMHRGASDARNLGIEAAKGDFISFVDGDDYIEKDMMVYLSTEK